MLREGPIPVFVHGLVEYAVGVLFIVAPLLLDWKSDTATAISVVIGVLVLLVAATTVGPTGLIKQLPVAAHVMLDYLLAVALIAIPFVAGFSDEGAPTAFFIALGVAHLLITVATRFDRRPRREARAERGA